MIDLKILENNMQNAVNHLMQKFNTLRSSRVSQNLLDSIEIEQYGAKVHLKHVALVNVLNSNSLKIDLFDKTLSAQVSKSIRDKLQLDAVEIGDGLKVTVPPMTEERQKMIVKQANEYKEDEKVVIRNLRRSYYDQLKKIKKEESLSEDDEKRLGNDIDKIHDQYIKQIDEIYKNKEKSILGT